MWKLIKAELLYYKTLLTILYAFVIPFFIINIFREGFEEHLARAMWITVPIIVIAINSEDKKSKKNPLYAKLPIPTLHIGISRLAIWVPFWLNLVFLFTISSLLNNHSRIDQYFPWIILTLASSMIIIGAFSSTVLDLRYCLRGRVMDQTLAVCIILIPWILAFLYLLMSISGPVGPYLARTFFSPTVSISMMFFASILLILSVIVFNQRRFFLE